MATIDECASRAATDVVAPAESRRPIAGLWAILAALPDPEIPVVSIGDLGILRGVEWDRDDPSTLVVHVTPTYSGCPATEAIVDSIRAALAPSIERVRVETKLAPGWTTDWMTSEGKRKLREFGIAPPGARRAQDALPIDISRLGAPRQPDAAVPCPRCASTRTERVSQFGSTACKAQYRCLACLEPFDYFKSH